MLEDRLRQREARAYRARVRRRRRLSFTIRLPLIVALLLGAGWLDRGLAGGPYARALLLIGIAVLVDELVGLPLALAGERDARAVGLSRLDTRAWARDRLRGAALLVGLGTPAIVALLWAQRTWPDGWWLAAWLAALALEVLLTVLFPILLLPLFVRSSPLPAGDLRSLVEELVERSGVTVADVRSLQLGARTSAGNAMVAGLGPTRRILLGDTLLEAGESESGGDPLLAPSRGNLLAETRAVLAHELAHHKHRDTVRFLILSAVMGMIEWLLAGRVLGALPRALAHGGVGHPAALPALLVLIALIAAPLGLLTAAVSRNREWAADAYAVTLVDGASLARAFERLTRNGLAELDPPRLDRLRASHPPLGARIARARQAAS